MLDLCTVMQIPQAGSFSFSFSRGLFSVTLGSVCCSVFQFTDSCLRSAICSHSLSSFILVIAFFSWKISMWFFLTSSVSLPRHLVFHLFQACLNCSLKHFSGGCFEVFVRSL